MWKDQIFIQFLLNFIFKTTLKITFPIGLKNFLFPSGFLAFSSYLIRALADVIFKIHWPLPMTFLLPHIHV